MTGCLTLALKRSLLTPAFGTPDTSSLSARYIGKCAAAPGKFVTGDPDHQIQTLNFSKEETKNPSRNEGCEKLGFEPRTP